MRHNLDTVLKSLNFWLGAFDDKSKYNVFIYSENIDLPADYNCYKILRKQDLISETNCKKLFNQIPKSTIVPHWRGAAFALSSPYFYPTEGELVYNIDADDIVIFGPIKDYIKKIEAAFIENNLITLSYDMHYSWHQGDYAPFRPHHWTFGVNLSRKATMKDIITKLLFKECVPNALWGNNIDYIIDRYLDTVDTKYVCFITASQLIHYISGDYNQNKCTKFVKNANKVETKLYGKTMYVNKHPRTLLIE